MFSITAIFAPPGYTNAIYGGLPPNVGPQQTGSRFGPQGSVYFVAIPGLGSLYLEDVGSTPSGWGVKVNGGPVWTYENEGAGQLSIQQSGEVTFSGGNGPVTSQIITNMSDCGGLVQKIYSVVMNTPSLQQGWQSDTLNTLYTVGFPRTCMYNMDLNCCQQFVALLAGLPLVGAEGTPQKLGSWLSCATCKAFETGLIAATAVALIAAIAAISTVTGGVGAAGLAYLEESASVAAIAAATRVSTSRVASLAATAFASGGVMSFLGDFIELLCREGGYCD